MAKNSLSAFLVGELENASMDCGRFYCRLQLQLLNIMGSVSPSILVSFPEVSFLIQKLLD